MMVERFENIKELLYGTVKKHENNIAYCIKTENEKKVAYRDITYKELLEEVNALGTKMFELGYKGRRVAIVGRNRYEWVLTHLSNLLGGMVSIPLDKEL